MCLQFFYSCLVCEYFFLHCELLDKILEQNFEKGNFHSKFRFQFKASHFFDKSHKKRKITSKSFFFPPFSQVSHTSNSKPNLSHFSSIFYPATTQMSNVFLKSDLAATAHQRKAPLGLRNATNQRGSGNKNSSSTNPILKKNSSANTYDFDYDANTSSIDKKLREFQNEVQQTENQQKARLEEDDDIVQRRMQQLQEREEKIKASIAGEKITISDPLKELPHRQILMANKSKKNDAVDEIGETAESSSESTNTASLLPKKLEENLYTDVYYLREKERQAKKQAKAEEEKAAKELEAKERKRKGTLANLAIKMKLNPEKYEGVDGLVTAVGKQGENDDTGQASAKKS